MLYAYTSHGCMHKETELDSEVESMILHNPDHAHSRQKGSFFAKPPLFFPLFLYKVHSTCVKKETLLLLYKMCSNSSNILTPFHDLGLMPSAINQSNIVVIREFKTAAASNTF